MKTKWYVMAIFLGFLAGLMMAVIDVKDSEASICSYTCGAACNPAPGFICVGVVSCGGSGCDCYTTGVCDQECCGFITCWRSCPPHWNWFDTDKNCACKPGACG